MANKPSFPTNLFFYTATVVGWVDIFTREQYRNILYECLDFCVKDGRFKLHAYVIMTNHIHLLVSGDPETIGRQLGYMKRSVSSNIKEFLYFDLQESRGTWMYKMFELSGINNCRNDDFQFWKHDQLKPFPLWTPKVIAQKCNYIHQNPVAMGLVSKPEYWKHSSAPQYAGMLATFPVEMVDILY